MYNILFICTGNICRTPMAHFELKRLIERDSLDDLIHIESAGTWATEGAPATEFSQLVCAENGLDASLHRAQGVDHYLMKNANLVLCMTTQHKDDLRQIFPQYKDKVFTLREFGRTNPASNLSINDPYGRSIERFRETFKEITHEVHRIYPILKTIVLQRNLV